MNEKGPGGNEWANQALFDYDGNALPAEDFHMMFLAGAGSVFQLLGGMAVPLFAFLHLFYPLHLLIVGLAAAVF